MSQLLIGHDAPDLTFTDVNGETFALSSLRGAPVVLNFLTSNCTWCRSQMSHLADVYERKHNVDVQVLGIFVGQDAMVAKQFADEQNLDIRIVADDAGQSQNAFQLERVPTFILLDGEGKIVCVYEGATEQLAGIIEQAVLAAAGHQELPEYSLVGNGCSVNGQ